MLKNYPILIWNHPIYVAKSPQSIRTSTNLRMIHPPPHLSLFAVISLLIVAAPALAQFHQNFEAAEVSWQRREADCAIPKASWQQRRSTDLGGKNRFEKVNFACGSGTEVFVSHDVPIAFVISELNPSVRIKATRPGIQLMVRVVLPNTPSPLGDGPLTTLLPGPTYRSAGEWETLSFSDQPHDLAEKLQQEIWLLRRKHGAQVNSTDAYIDGVILNLYTGTGETVIQIDDLKVDGIVDATGIARRVTTGEMVRYDSGLALASYAQAADSTSPSPTSSASEKHPSLVVRDGTILLVAKKPFMPRVIQHHGESFEFLQSLGFNTIEMTATATYEQLQSARRLDMWIVCPPPSSAGLSPIEFQYDRVLAWSVGQNLGGRDLLRVAERVREIRESDLRVGRPVVADVNSHWGQFANHVDILNVGLEPIGSSFLASQYSDWLAQRGESVSHNKPLWADIQTDFPKQLTKQISSITRAVPPTPLEPQQMKFLAYEAIAGGARGMRFRSRSRLDGTDPSTRLRAMTIEWLNSELVRLEPWIAGGAILGAVPTNDPELEVTAIGTNRARLLLIQRPTHHEQYIAGDVPVRTVTFSDPNTTFTQQVMLIGESGLESLPSVRQLGSNQITIENCPLMAAVVLSETPLVFHNLNQSYQRPGKLSTLQLHTELTRQWLAIMQLIDRQMARMGRSTTAASNAMNEAANSFRNASGLQERNSLAAAIPLLHQTDERLAFARREMITEPLGQFQSKMSSPLIAHTSLVPLHWELAKRLETQQWNPNGLAGGDFENLQHLQRSGWENRRLDDDLYLTKVELSDAAAVSGKFGLRLEVGAKTSATTIDATPLWITTPKVPVRAGQLVRIHGWVNIPKVIHGNMDGLMINDSLGGDAMAERIPVTNGWQEFTLYRGVPADGNLDVTFSLTGIGVAHLDEVTIRTVDIPVGERQARTE